MKPPGEPSPQEGQALVFTALAGPALAVLILFLANLGILGTNRTKTWAGTDLSALSAGTLYARGLNILSMSNAFVVAAAGLDALALATEKVDPHSRLLVQHGQDLFVKVWPALMEGGALWAARENNLRFGLLPVPSPLFVWNPEAGGSPAPSLNVRRRTLWELLVDSLGFEPDAEPKEAGKGQKPSYIDSDGVKHEFDYSDVEPAGTYESGRPRYRVKQTVPDSEGKHHAGKFVKVGEDGGSGTKSGGGPGGLWRNLGKKILSQIEADLVDDVKGVHTVLLYANRETKFWIGGNRNLAVTAETARLQHALAEAEAYGGSLEFWKEGPNFDGRLRKVSPEALGWLPLGKLGSVLAGTIRH